MKYTHRLLLIVAFAFAPLLAHAQGTAFTYQGRLTDNGSPANGTYDLQFTLFGAPTGGSPVAGPVASAPTDVSNGLFTVTLDFGAAPFMGADRWLDIGVRTNGSVGPYTPLFPRQLLTPTPYALHAFNAANLMSLVNAPLDIKVNGQRAMRFEPNSSGAPNVIGGSAANEVAPGVVGATIGGGGATSLFGVGHTNRVRAGFGTIGGGLDNTIEANAVESFIGGGERNIIGDAADLSVIGGGFGNTIGSLSARSTIAGGILNSVSASANYSTISGGHNNSATGIDSTVGGGHLNRAGEFATVGGGGLNRATGMGSVVAGGGGTTFFDGDPDYGNHATAAWSAILGGANNRAAGEYSNVGGGQSNTVELFVHHATIGGGAENYNGREYGTIGGGEKNRIGGFYATVGGGRLNTSSGGFSTVAGGYQNSATEETSTVGGGFANTAGHESSTIAGGAGNTTSADYATIGGGSANVSSDSGATVGGGIQNRSTGPAATVAGGDFNRSTEAYAAVGGGAGNLSTHMFATIAGGQDNRAQDYAATISGGSSNVCHGQAGVIGGGFHNEAGNFATVGGGYTNAATGSHSTIAGGQGNLALNDNSTVGGGHANEARHSYVTIAGGGNNLATDAYATISGGANNKVIGSGGTIPGGFANTATNFAFAAGINAAAIHQGSFVWADAHDSDLPPFSSSNTNEFAVRATGGVRFVSAMDETGSNTAGVTLAPGSGMWAPLSDRNAKENLAPINSQEVLSKVIALPLASWNYKAQNKSIRHLGPMAQDFHAAFGLGENNTSIGTVDADGVALAAIQGLNQKLTEQLQVKDSEIQQLRRAVIDLQKAIQEIAPDNKP